MGFIDTKQEIIGKEIFRMVNAIRDPNPKSTVLEELLDGSARTVENVIRIRGFAAKHMGSGPNSLQSRVFAACDAFLQDSMDPKEFKKLIKPPEPKYPGGILEELGIKE